MDYLESPTSHDVFGHVPLLANPVYSNFMQAYGKGGQRRFARRLPNLARLYFGTRSNSDLLRTPAACASSAPDHVVHTESVFALESQSPNRIASISNASCAPDI